MSSVTAVLGTFGGQTSPKTRVETSTHRFPGYIPPVRARWGGHEMRRRMHPHDLRDHVLAVVGVVVGVLTTLVLVGGVLILGAHAAR